MGVISPVSAEKSNIVYMQVLDAKSESRDTLMTIFFDLHQRFIEHRGNEFLVLTADAKLYEVLQTLKHEDGEELKWLLPFPGDWHMRKNFQVALMKPYFHMGLKELARAAGYPVAAIQSCSQFKRTHYFVIEIWQALYLVMLQWFIDADMQQGNPSSYYTDIVQNATLHLKSSDFVVKLNQLRNQLQQSAYYDKFNSFIDAMACKGPNWKFWKQFVFEDHLVFTHLCGEKVANSLPKKTTRRQVTQPERDKRMVVLAQKTKMVQTN